MWRSIYGVIINSGQANACTGTKGDMLAKRMTGMYCLLADPDLHRHLHLHLHLHPFLIPKLIPISRCVALSTESTSRALGVPTGGGVLVVSTGVIGELPDEDKILSGIDCAAQSLSSSGWLDASKAIMTTDLVPKTSFATVGLSGDMTGNLFGVSIIIVKSSMLKHIPAVTEHHFLNQHSTRLQALPKALA